MLLAALIWPVAAAQAQSFTTPGAWSYTVPAGVTLVEVKVSGGGGGGGGYFGGSAGTSQNDAFTATGGTSGASCYENTAAIQYTAISASGAAGSAGNGGSAIAPGARGADGYVSISTAAISVTKSAQPVSNPINGTTNPQLIPGATEQYCITLTNGWARSATSVSISDSIPAQAS